MRDRPDFPPKASQNESPAIPIGLMSIAGKSDGKNPFHGHMHVRDFPISSPLLMIDEGGTADTRVDSAGRAGLGK